MSQGKIPTPYVNDVKEDNSTMQYVAFDTMGIGARKSGIPSGNTNGIKGLDHVGMDASHGAGKTPSTGGRK